MALTADEYTAWLQNPNKNRVLLIDVNYYPNGGGAEATRYIGTRNGGTFGYYDAIINGAPTLSRHIGSAFGSETSATIGAIDIANDDGAIDSWLYDSWSGRDITIYFGDISWDLTDIKARGVIFTGKVENFQIIDDTKARLTIRDRLAELDKAIMTDTLGTTDNPDELKPLALGTCLNVTPVLIDASTHKYKVHDGQVNDVATTYYKNGKAITSPTLSKDNTNGEFTLASDPDGTLTVDVEGVFTGGAHLTKPGELFKEVVKTYGGLVDADLDTASITAYDTGMTGTIEAGVFIKGRSNILSVLDELITFRLGWYGFNRAGLLSMGILVDPSGETATFSLDDGMTYGSIRIKRDGVPRWKTTIGYGKNYTEIKTPDSGVGETRKDFLEKDYELSVYEDASKATIQAEFLDAEAPEPEKTCITYSNRADDEAANRQGLFNTQRYRFAVTVFAEGLEIDLGHIGTITDSRYSLTSQKFMVVGIDDNVLDGTVKIEGWF